ncbi:MAG: chemotaxis protein CheW [Planctomyces sp.]
MFGEVVKEFLVESEENLDQLDRDFLALEESPDDRNLLSSIFRTIHTIKGTSGFLGFSKLERITHQGEGLLVRLRDGALRLSEDMASELLHMVDSVREILAQIDQSGREGDGNYDQLTARLEALRESESAAVSSMHKPDTAAATVVANTESANIAPVAASSTAERKTAGPDNSAIRKDTPEPASEPFERNNDGSDRTGSAAESSVRIDVNLLDRLMNLVGELVLARNQILQFSHEMDDSRLSAVSQRINLITTELQEGVMKTRMQPIRNAWNKIPRVVRDLSICCGKQVQVRMDGAETELDKTILEAIKDPLTHIVRNSVDHGIEPADVRKKAGKSPEGTLWLRAYHEGGQVILEIADDGAGIHVGRVREKAVEKGLVTQEQADALSDREAIQLILLPGFSTAAAVTSVSGRGVGMDVVKTNVEKIGGTLDIHSQPGVGTTLRIRIPLTLAIVPALIIRCSGDEYCIPQISLQELVRLDGENARRDIELLHSVPVYRLRGQLLPIIYLDEQLHLRPARLPHQHSQSVINIVVLEAEDQRFGLVVDDISDTQEIVVKPLAQQLKHISTYAGSTIMGDGSVSLIIDVAGLARKAHVLTGSSGRGLPDGSVNDELHLHTGESWLIVDPRDGTRAAIPLSTVSRIEEIAPTDIECTGHQNVIQYRGGIMPLVSLNQSGVVEPDEYGAISVVVYENGFRSIGVVVGRILDIQTENEAQSGHQGHQDSRIIAGKITRMIDLAEVTMGI